MITTQEALGQTRTIVSAVEHALDRAMAQARRLTQGGQGIDDHQVHCERLAYRATELQAAQALLRYADLSGPDGQFATIDYGLADEAEALYVGREVTLDEIGVREIASEEDRQVRDGFGFRPTRLSGLAYSAGTFAVRAAARSLPLPLRSAPQATRAEVRCRVYRLVGEARRGFDS